MVVDCGLLREMSGEEIFIGLATGASPSFMIDDKSIAVLFVLRSSFDAQLLTYSLAKVAATFSTFQNIISTLLQWRRATRFRRIKHYSATAAIWKIVDGEIVRCIDRIPEINERSIWRFVEFRG